MTYSEEMRSSVVASLESLASEFGFVPNRVVAELATDLNVGQSTIRKWAASSSESKSEGHLDALADEHIEVVFKHMANLARAKRELDKKYPDVFKAMSYSSFRRRWLSVDQGVREMAKGGATALMKVQPKMLFEAAAPNDLWHIDHQELPIWVLPRGHRTNPVKPWCTTVQDDRTRRIMSVLLTVTAATAESTMVTLADGMLLRPLSVEGQFVGGVPTAIHSDNGGEFRSSQYTQFLGRLGITRKLTFPYMKHQNGKVERVQKTMQQDLVAALPGFADGPETLKRKDLFGLDGPLIDEDALWERLLNWVEAYNSERPHSALAGQTPNQVWVEHDPSLRQPDPEATRLAMLVESKPRKVQPTGVYFDGQYYTSPELGAAQLIGAEVVVRYMPMNLSFIEVYYNDKWVATAYPHASLTPAQREALDEMRRAQYKDARSYHAAAAERRSLESDIDPEALIYTEAFGPPAEALAGDDQALFDLMDAADIDEDEDEDEQGDEDEEERDEDEERAES